MKSYSEKLRDPRWQRKRLEILQRDQFTCIRCGNKESTLHVHHWEYNGDPWEADSTDLDTMCDSCHAYTEELIRLVRQSGDRAIVSILKQTIRWAMSSDSAKSSCYVQGADALLLFGSDTAESALNDVVPAIKAVSDKMDGIRIATNQ